MSLRIHPARFYSANAVRQLNFNSAQPLAAEAASLIEKETL
jgi:hypothetical protein